ncbi:MAG: hypothetical protein ABIS23_04755 [Sphingomicrobium sp.]
MARMFLELAMWPGEERDELGAGRAMLCNLQRQLEQAGFGLREGVAAWEDYGWSLVVDHLGSTIWCMVQASDRWLLQCWPESGLVDRLRGRNHEVAQREVMAALLLALAAGRTIPDARWMSLAELKRA